MKKTVLNWIGQALAIVALSTVGMTAAVAQSVDEDFARELKLVEGLKVYNDQLQKQLDAQVKAQADIRKSIASSKDLEPQVVPLMNKMLGALEQFIRSDLPFHLDERLESIKDYMTQALYQSVARGISNADRALFSFLLSANIAKHKGKISEQDWKDFISVISDSDKS